MRVLPILLCISNLSAGPAENARYKMTRQDTRCKYSCTPNAGCQVDYTGPITTGSFSGACFSEEFGGACNGTPLECQDCKEVVDCKEPSKTITTPAPTSHPHIKGDASGNLTCKYSCLDNGGCEVKYLGAYRPGLVSGSCFSEKSGGFCSGAPTECHICKEIVDCIEHSTTTTPPPSTTTIPPPSTTTTPPPSTTPTPPPSTTTTTPPSTTIKATMSTAAITTTIPSHPHIKGDVTGNLTCKYTCLDNGGCEVKYLGAYRPGMVSGSCVSEKSGDSCSGAPQECHICNEIVDCIEHTTTTTTAPSTTSTKSTSIKIPTVTNTEQKKSSKAPANIPLKLLKPNPTNILPWGDHAKLLKNKVKWLKGHLSKLVSRT